MRTIEEVKQYALENRIPIMEDEGMEFLCAFILENGIRDILEAGSAIGYSAMKMASVHKDIRIVTLEKDPEKARLAQENIAGCGYSDQVESRLEDARKYNSERVFDMVLIDAAKTANEAIFRHLSGYVKKGGYLVTDDIKFHGFPDHPKIIRSRHFKELALEVKRYREAREKDPLYETRYVDAGDGILISKKL